METALAKVRVGSWVRQNSPQAVKTLYWFSRAHYEHLRQMRRLVRPLCNFLRDKVSLQRAEEEIRRRLDAREECFLELVRAHVYERPGTSYHRLLKHAGCDFADLRAYIRRHGLEETLHRLAGEGVYLTSEEFKGKKEVVRGTESFRVCPTEFENFGSDAGYGVQSSGTRNLPVPSFVRFEWLALRAYVTCVFFSAHDLFSYSHAMHDAILPGSGGINNLLMYSKIGIATDRWFARVIPGFKHRHHVWTTFLIVLLGKLIGPAFPRPQFINIGTVHRIVQWILEENRRGRLCCVTAAASNATRIAKVAGEMGVFLKGTKFICVGEPLTEAKREMIERVGATGTTRYAYGGNVSIGFGCAHPVYTDEIHVNQYLLALVSHSRAVGDPRLSIHPLLCTTLDAASPRILLNVESGDYATFDKRNCGCALEKAGLALHLHRIRSFEKFTSEGVNYNYTDLFELMEKIFPTEFGGSPGDYQLVEEEDEHGQTRISLLVHPDIGKVNDEMLLVRLRELLGDKPWHSRFWQDAGTFRVKREAPHASARGKILPLHIAH